jgi:hypothetical protein
VAIFIISLARKKRALQICLQGRKKISSLSVFILVHLWFKKNLSKRATKMKTSC